MKRNSLVSLGLIGMLTLAISGCNIFDEHIIPDPSTKGDFVIMVAPETKTEMSENTVIWSADDTLSVFAAESETASYGDNVKFTYESDNKFTGSLTLPLSAYDWYVLYPYNSEIETPFANDKTSSGAIRIGCAAGSYQEQIGNNSSAHLAGQYFPLYGRKPNVASAEIPQITLRQALSIIKVHVTNNTSKDLTVNEVSFTGTEPIAGSFYINFAADSAVMSPATGSSSTAKLKVKDGTAIAANDTANFYLAVKPFKANSGSTLTLAVNGYEKTLDLTKDVSFKEGKIRTLNFDTPTEFPPLLEAWEETALSDINAGDVFVMVGNGTYAVNNTLNTSAGGPKPVPVTIDETKAVAGSTIVGAPADSIKWTLTGNNTDGYIFYSYADGNNYLYCSTTNPSGSNDNMRVGPSGNRKLFVLEGNQLKTNDEYTTRYIGINGTSDFRGYVSASTSSVTFKFYKQDSKYAEAYAITIDPDINGGTVSTDPAGTQYETSIVKLTATPEAGNFFTSWDVYKTDDISVKVTVENDQFTMPGYPVTVSAEFGSATLTVGEITPAKAECIAGSEVTFTVTSNVEWTASTEDDTVISSISPDGTQSPSANPQTVTVTFTANNGAERTADIDIAPVDPAYSDLAQTVTVTQKKAEEYYELISTVNELETGDYVIVGMTGSTYYAMPSISTGKISGTEVSVNNGKISATTGDNYAITITKNGDGQVAIGSGSTYLQIQTSGTDFGVTTTANYYPVTVQNGAFDVSNTRHLAWRNTSNVFGNYASIFTSEYCGVYLFKKIDNTVWDLKSIAVKTEPKTSYEAGEFFNPAGLVLTATYEDHDGVKADKTVDVTYSAENASEFTFSPSTSTALTTEDESVTITWGGKSTSQEITVTAPVTWDLKSIAVTNAPTKTTYTEGECFNPADMVVTATFENHNNTAQTKQETVDNANLTFDPALDDELSTDDESVTISYTVSGITKTTTQAITVNSASAITYYEKVTTAPSDWSGDYLIVYEVNSTSGYVLTGVTSNIGQYADVTIADGKIVANDYDSYNIEIAKSSSSYTMKMGSVYLAYTNLTTSKNNNLYTVENASDDGALWTLSVDDAQNVYNTSRYLRWNNNSGQYRFCCYVSGQQKISFYKLADNTTWDLKSIAVKTAPGKTSYEAGEDFNPAGLVLTATYEDHDGVKAEKTEDVTYSAENASQFTFSPSTALTAGTTSVTISYTDSDITKSTTQAITVTAPVTWDLKSIAVTNAPNKTTYTEGEYFNPAGMVVTATFENHNNTAQTKQETVDNANLTFNPALDDELSTDDESVTISYTFSGITKTTTQAIEVSSSITTTSYTKVTSTPSSWAGTYILVYEESSTSGRVCTAGVDAASNYVTATIASGVITSNDLSDCEVEIATYSTGYSVKALGGTNANKYLEGKGNSNGTTFAASASKVTTLSISNGVVTITNNTNVFAYNSTANNLRWRFFKSGTAAGSGYYKPALYKKN